MLFLCENALVETMRDCESCRNVRVSDSRTDTESTFCLRDTRLYSLGGLIGVSGGGGLYAEVRPGLHKHLGQDRA